MAINAKVKIDTKVTFCLRIILGWILGVMHLEEVVSYCQSHNDLRFMLMCSLKYFRYNFKGPNCK